MRNELLKAEVKEVVGETIAEYAYVVVREVQKGMRWDDVMEDVRHRVWRLHNEKEFKKISNKRGGIGKDFILDEMMDQIEEAANRIKDRV